jgi:hypothetical protein
MCGAKLQPISAKLSVQRTHLSDKGRSKMIGLLAFCFSVEPWPSGATAQQPAPTTLETSAIAGRAFKLPIEIGHCALDAKHERDAAVIASLAAGSRGARTLHAATVLCSDLQPWRDGKRATLSDMQQMYSLVPTHDRKRVGQEAAVVREVCDEFDELIRRDAVPLKPGEIPRGVTYVAVLLQQEFACHVAGLSRGTDASGQPTTKLNVVSITALNGVAFVFNRVHDEATSERTRELLVAQQAHIEAFEKLNLATGRPDIKR